MKGEVLFKGDDKFMWSISMSQIIMGLIVLVVIGFGLGIGITFAQKLFGGNKKSN